MRERLFKIREFFGGQSWRDLIYFSSTILFFAVVFFLFVWSTVFLVRSINAVAGKPELRDLEANTFDLEGFSKAAKRLNIPLILPTPVLPAAPAPGVSLPVSPVGSTQESSKKTPLARQAVRSEDVSINILNGTNVAGLARRWQDYFTKAGFDKITIGNAQKKNYVGVIIKYKTNFSDILDTVQKVISINGGKVASSEVEDNLGYDIIIILGR